MYEEFQSLIGKENNLEIIFSYFHVFLFFFITGTKCDHKIRFFLLQKYCTITVDYVSDKMNRFSCCLRGCLLMERKIPYFSSSVPDPGCLSRIRILTSLIPYPRSRVKKIADPRSRIRVRIKEYLYF
jgi:hypothetical protein